MINTGSHTARRFEDFQNSNARRHENRSFSHEGANRQPTRGRARNVQTVSSCSLCKRIVPLMCVLSSFLVFGRVAFASSPALASQPSIKIATASAKETSSVAKPFLSHPRQIHNKQKQVGETKQPPAKKRSVEAYRRKSRQPSIVARISNNNKQARKQARKK